jgi:hypothetical protein
MSNTARRLASGSCLLLLALLLASCQGAGPAPQPVDQDPPVVAPPADPPATDPPDTTPPDTTPPTTDPPATDPPATDPPDTTPPAPTLPTDYQFSVQVSTTSYRYGGSAASFDTTWAYVPSRQIHDDITGDLALDLNTIQDLDPSIPLLQVRVHAHDAQDLRMAFCSLSYDATRLQPVLNTRGPALGADARTSLPPALPQPGTEQFAVFLLNPDMQTGVSFADDVVANFYFMPPGFVDAGPPGAPLPAPMLPDCSVTLSYDAAAGALTWGYLLPGDFDQNGVLDLDDFATWAVHFGGNATDLDSIEGVIHNAATGTVGYLDLPRWGMHSAFAVDSYNVYSGAAADYPAGGTLLGNVPLSSASGDPAMERLKFAFAIPAPAAGTHYWVKPVNHAVAGVASNDVTP